jgi:hypothetical protein
VTGIGTVLKWHTRVEGEEIVIGLDAEIEREFLVVEREVDDVRSGLWEAGPGATT